MRKSFICTKQKLIAISIQTKSSYDKNKKENLEKIACSLKKSNCIFRR